jgi:hypothetical protein
LLEFFYQVWIVVGNRNWEYLRGYGFRGISQKLLDDYPGTIPLPSSRFFERLLQGTDSKLGINIELMDKAAENFHKIQAIDNRVLLTAFINSDGTDFGMPAIVRGRDKKIHGAVHLGNDIARLDLSDDIPEVAQVENELNLMKRLRQIRCRKLSVLEPNGENSRHWRFDHDLTR